MNEARVSSLKTGVVMIIGQRMLVVMAAALCGCTHVQLRNNSLNQAHAVHQLQQQQVLDNLAMFVVDPNALPFFTIPGAGTSAVSDQGSASTSLNWLRAGFQSIGLTVGGSRLQQENFTLAPLSDPDKLARMRCAYQAAVGYSGTGCIDCCNLEKRWGDATWDGRVAPEKCVDECSPQPGWFCTGCKKDVPKNAPYVANYGSTYVWVLPHGTDELARLTLAILDYATAVAAPPKTKTVTTTIRFPVAEGEPERIVEETVVVPLTPSEFHAMSTEATGEPADRMLPAPLRQNFFIPQELPQVVIPLQSF